MAVLLLWGVGLFPGGGGASAAEMRTWTSTSGSKIEAKLAGVAGNLVTLENAEGRTMRVQLHQLSVADQVYVANPPEERGSPSVEGIDAQPGRISPRIVCQTDANWSYHVYLPKEFHDGREWPVWFIMSPGGGKNGKALKRYIKGAEALGCVLALSVESKNGFENTHKAVHAMVADVRQRFPVIDGLSFSSGFSGGSRMAYYLAEKDKNIQGILACGSGSGVYLPNDEFRPARLRSSTYVYSLVGARCFNRTGAFSSHLEFPDHYRLHFFPGNHDWAGGALIRLGMTRVLGEALKQSALPEARKLRGRYLASCRELVDGLEETEPWEAWIWAEFLSGFPGPPALQMEYRKKKAALEAQPQVKLAREAEKDIRTLCRKFYKDVFYTQDQKPNAKREEMANRMADAYASIPHGELIRALGSPAK